MILNRIDCFTLGIEPLSKVIVQKLILNICPKKIFLMRFSLQESKLLQVNQGSINIETKQNIENNFFKWCKREKYISSGCILDLEGKLYRCCFNEPFNQFGNLVKFSYIHELPSSLECILEPGILTIQKTLFWLGETKFKKFNFE